MLQVWERERERERVREEKRERERGEGLGQLYLTLYLLKPRCDSIFGDPLSTSLTGMIRATSQQESTGPLGHAQGGFCSDCPLSWLTAFFVGVETVCTWLRISYKYIFSTSLRFPFCYQFTWFISTVPLFTLVHILFRNPHITYSQRSICNITPLQRCSRGIRQP